jgi:hypothetical protein
MLEQHLNVGVGYKERDVIALSLLALRWCQSISTTYLNWLPAQDEERLGSLGQETGEFVN